MTMMAATIDALSRICLVRLRLSNPANQGNANNAVGC